MQKASVLLLRGTVQKLHAEHDFRTAAARLGMT